MAKVLGIDLGTTNSVAAVIEAGEPFVEFFLRVFPGTEPGGLGMKQGFISSDRHCD